MPAFEPVSPEQIPELSTLATSILREHYDPILGKAQNDYMLQKFQSPEAMQQQLSEGYRYYFITDEGEKAGFAGFYPKDGKMYISKLYVSKSHRRRHLARDCVAFISRQAQEEGLSALFLNVNRHNDGSIAAYQKMGFSIQKTEDNPIGCGYYMNDYVMEKPV